MRCPNVALYAAASETQPNLARLQNDAIFTGFSTQACDHRSLSAMSAASFVFSASRLFFSSALFRLSTSQSFVNAGSWALSLCAEVASFRAVSQVFSPENQSNPWYDPKDFAASLADFALLKGSGLLFKNHPAVLRFASQTNAMVVGEVFAESLSLREKTDRGFIERYAHAAATNFTLEVGASIAGGITGGSLGLINRNLESSFRQVSLSQNSHHIDVPRFVSNAEDFRVRAIREFRRALAEGNREEVLKAEVQRWLASKDPAAMDNLGASGVNMKGLDPLSIEGDKRTVAFIRKCFAEQGSIQDVLDLLDETLEVPPALRESVMTDPPYVPEAVQVLQSFASSGLNRGDDIARAAEGLYSLTLPRLGQEAPLDPASYWDRAISLDLFSRTYAVVRASHFGERVDLYQAHLQAALRVATQANNEFRNRRLAVFAILDSGFTMEFKETPTDEIRAIRQRCIDAMLAAAIREPAVIWHNLADAHSLGILIKEGYLTRTQVLNGLIGACARWAENPREGEGFFGEGDEGYVQRKVVETWLKLVKPALEAGEHPFGEWVPDGADSRTAITSLSDPSTPLGKFFNEFFRKNPREKDFFARLLVNHTELDPASYGRVLAAADQAHDAGPDARGDAYITLLGGVKSPEAVDRLLRELRTIMSFYGVESIEEASLFSASPWSANLPAELASRPHRRLESVLVALRAQDAILPPALIRTIMVGMARHRYAESRGNSYYFMDLQQIALALYEFNPSVVMTTYHEIAGQPLPIFMHDKLAHRFEGVLTSLIWFAERERMASAQRIDEALSKWREIFGGIKVEGAEWGDMVVSPGLPLHFRMWGTSNRVLMDCLQNVTDADVLAWKEYLGEHPERVTQLEEYASLSPAHTEGLSPEGVGAIHDSHTQALAIAILERLNPLALP